MSGEKYYFEEHPFDVIEMLDSKRDQAWEWIYLSKVDAIFKMLDLRKDSKVLDVGCGTGYASLRYDGFYNRGIEVVSTDVSKSEVNLGRRYARELDRPQEFLVGDGLSLPFKGNSFNAAFCINLLHHIEDHRSMIKEMARVACKVCCVEPNNLNPVHRRYQKTEVAKRAGDTKSFYLHELKNDFRYIGLKNIKTKRICCVYPKLSGKLLKFMIKVEPFLEITPILNLISGSLMICGEK
jgi:ubiquinone/menaquinone biosynthesis C-methylase UbiE